MNTLYQKLSTAEQYMLAQLELRRKLRAVRLNKTRAITAVNRIVKVLEAQ